MKFAFAAVILVISGCAAMKSQGGGSDTTLDAPLHKIIEALNRRMALKDYQVRPAPAGRAV